MEAATIPATAGRRARPTAPRSAPGATRLGLAIPLKPFQAEGRSPRRPEDVPAARGRGGGAPGAFAARNAEVGVPAAEWRGDDRDGRAIRLHRVQLRAAPGLREITDGDARAHVVLRRPRGIAAEFADGIGS